MQNTARHSVRNRYGVQYWATLLVLNLVAVAMGRAWDRILFVDALIVALFGMAVVATRLWRWFQPDSN
jgi:hypothetical protein